MNMRLVLAILLSAGLAACGGSSGGGGTTGTAPGAPTGVTAVANDGYILLDANPPSGTVTGFNVYWSIASGVSKSSPDKFAVGYATPQAHTGLASNTTYYYVVTAVNAAGEGPASAQVSARTTAVAAGGGDPLYVDQWHLLDTNQPGANGIPAANNVDVNVAPSWTAGYKGQGVRIAIVDDGIEIGHEDLASNMGANILSHNYVTGAPSSTDPSYSSDPSYDVLGHGTSCAGIAAARDDNGLGGRGVAPRATLVGYNATLNLTDSNEAGAMSLNVADVSISSNSWGATDGTGELAASTSLWKSAINTGLTTGRGGKGTIYLWAAGNGSMGGNGKPCPNWTCSDNSNYDGQANYRGVMAVAAINDQGVQSYYSESGANLWVAAPGGEWCTDQGVSASWHAITTVDRTGTPGENSGTTPGDYTNGKYTKCMNGTSSATPGVAGAVAVLLSANPNLGWRDVKTILAITSRGNDWGTLNPDTKSRSTGWLLNGGGYWFHHKYGFGLVNTDLAVQLAIGAIDIGGNVVTGTKVPWVNLGPEVAPKEYSSTFASKKSIPDNNTGTAWDEIDATGSGIGSIEWVEVTFTATHPYIGDLDVTLTNMTSGMVSHLAVPHFCAGTNHACTSTYTGWVFGSAAHFNEAATGLWRLTVKDGYANGTGTFDSWKIKFYGH